MLAIPLFHYCPSHSSWFQCSSFIACSPWCGQSVCVERTYIGLVYGAHTELKGFLRPTARSTRSLGLAWDIVPTRKKATKYG